MSQEDMKLMPSVTRQLLKHEETGEVIGYDLSTGYCTKPLSEDEVVEAKKSGMEGLRYDNLLELFADAAQWAEDWGPCDVGWNVMWEPERKVD